MEVVAGVGTVAVGTIEVVEDIAAGDIVVVDIAVVDTPTVVVLWQDKHRAEHSLPCRLRHPFLPADTPFCCRYLF